MPFTRGSDGSTTVDQHVRFTLQRTETDHPLWVNTAVILVGVLCDVVYFSSPDPI